jgi:hypothetical protein
MKAEIDVSVGDIIFYRLEPKSLPVNPERIWKGRVEWSHGRKCLFMIVSSLEEEYEGMSEIVYTTQIIRIERKEDHA